MLISIGVFWDIQTISSVVNLCCSLVRSTMLPLYTFVCIYFMILCEVRGMLSEYNWSFFSEDYSDNICVSEFTCDLNGYGIIRICFYMLCCTSYYF